MSLSCSSEIEREWILLSYLLNVMLFHASDYDENDNYDVSNDKKRCEAWGTRETLPSVFVLHSLACNAFIISEVVF